ncbi:MAG: J domain-containing protein [Chloroflexi bacterium]|nr:J domain-containing protein [Chloroflexota bacterium]
MADYYDVLEVSRSAGEKEIRQAFRKAAKKHHPDLNPGDKASEKRFKEVNEAYEVLSDADKRKKYDLYGDNWKHAGQFESRYGQGRSPFSSGRSGGSVDFGSDLLGGLGDLLGRSSGRAGRTAAVSRLEAPVTVTLEDAFSGSVHNLTISSYGGERRVEVTVPPGVDTGSTVRIAPDKETEVLIKVTVSPHRRFERKGADLYTEAQVPFEDAILGGETQVDSLTGRLHLKVPARSQNGQRIRLAGQGMPRLKDPKARGDLYVTLRPILPKEPTEEQIELLTELRRLRTEGT